MVENRIFPRKKWPFKRITYGIWTREASNTQIGALTEQVMLDNDDFVQMLAEHQRRLRAYVFTLGPDCSHADDVLQDASVALWKRRDAYDRSRDFFPWACGVALIEVLRYRRKMATDRLQFDDALINTLSMEYLERSDDVEVRQAALADCLKKLSGHDYWLITSRYSVGTRVPELAASIGRPASTVYSALARIREVLHRCVERTLALNSRGAREST